MAPSHLILTAVLMACYNSIDLYYTRREQSKEINCPKKPTKDVCNLHVTRKLALFNSTINCAVDKDCHLNCNGDSSCRNSTINCPSEGNANCYIICNGKHSCQGSNVYISSGNLLKIECNQYKGCAHISIVDNSINGAIMELSANKMDGGLFNCSINAKLSKSIRINAAGISPLTFGSIYCPINAKNTDLQKNCVIDVLAPATKYVYGSLHQLKIYSVESFKYLTVTYNNFLREQHKLNSPLLFCTSTYEENCTLVLDHFEKWMCKEPSQCDTEDDAIKQHDEL